jgi:hypothetical protein
MLMASSRAESHYRITVQNFSYNLTSINWEGQNDEDYSAAFVFAESTVEEVLVNFEKALCSS